MKLPQSQSAFIHVSNSYFLIHRGTCSCLSAWARGHAPHTAAAHTHTILFTVFLVVIDSLRSTCWLDSWRFSLFLCSLTEEDVCICLLWWSKHTLWLIRTCPYMLLSSLMLYTVWKHDGRWAFSHMIKWWVFPPLAPLRLHRYPPPHPQNLIVLNIGKWCLSHIGKCEFDLYPPLLNCTQLGMQKLIMFNIVHKHGRKWKISHISGTVLPPSHQDR